MQQIRAEGEQSVMHIKGLGGSGSAGWQSFASWIYALKKAVMATPVLPLLIIAANRKQRNHPHGVSHSYFPMYSSILSVSPSTRRGIFTREENQ
jgi:hypothetical protein